RHQFGALQHRVFPAYFLSSITLSFGLLSAYVYKHPGVAASLADPLDAEVAQAYTIGSVLLFQGVNWAVIGPLTSSIMFKRQKLEKEEGKVYTDPGVSEEMKALNRRFAAMHGYSSLANLVSFIALAFHGLWIGTYGL
ncbi:hypothetical protein FISHEDRAFT_42378, partial [Fistulina hepatica ATCC 64428]